MLEEIKRHVGVVVEGLRSEVRIIAEQYGDIMRKLEEHDVRFDRIDLDLKGMKIALFDNSHRLNDHDARIRKLETR
jgi:tmRNA-binding protein